MSLAARLQLDLPQSYGLLDQMPGAAHLNKLEDRGRKQHDQASGRQEREAKSLREEVLFKTIGKPRALNSTPASKSRLGLVHPIDNSATTSHDLPASTSNSFADRDAANIHSDGASKQGAVQVALTQGETSVCMPRVPSGNSKGSRMGASLRTTTHEATEGTRPSPDANIQGDTPSVVTMKVPGVVLVPHPLPLGRSSVLTSDVRKSSASTSTIIAPVQHASVGSRISVRMRVLDAQLSNDTVTFQARRDAKADNTSTIPMEMKVRHNSSKSGLHDGTEGQPVGP